MKGERSKPARQALKAEVSSLRKELIKRQHKSVVDLLAAAQVRALYPLPCTLHPVPCTLTLTPHRSALDGADRRGPRRRCERSGRQPEHIGPGRLSAYFARTGAAGGERPHLLI